MASLSGSYALSGPLSRRSLGTQSGTLRRLARQVERDGGNPQQILTASAAAELAEPRIGSADSDIREQAYTLRASRGLAEGRRRSLLDPVDAPAAPAAPSPAAAPSRTQSTIAPVGSTGSAPSRNSLLQGRAPARQGLIDGKPAGSVLAGMRAAAPRETEPGNMAEVQAAKPFVGPPAVGPLQKALNEAMARNAQRERDETSDEIVMEPAPAAAAPAPLSAPTLQGIPAGEIPETPAAPAPRLVRDKNPVTFGGPSTVMDFRREGERLEREKNRREGALRGGRIRAAQDAVKIPKWQEGTGLGAANRSLQRFLKPLTVQ